MLLKWLKDFKKMYASKIEDSEKCFKLFTLKKLDVNDWKGDKIDEKKP